jgi:DNA-binding beta-propeller fold protein YncE
VKKFLLLLIPLVLLAQVQVDTVIHLPSYLFNGFFIPELNKLYVHSRNRILVVDCSTYQLKAEIPTTSPDNPASFAWSPRWQKLYFCVFQTSLMVIDAVADTVLKRIPFVGPLEYAASVDRLYIGGGSDATPVIDCATDSVVRMIPSPVSGYGFGYPSWDSVGNKLYFSIGAWGAPPAEAVYDCATDSLVALIDVSRTTPYAPGRMNFDQTYRKAYYTSGSAMGGGTGVIDTKADTVIKRLPFNVLSGDFNPVAVNARNHKAYMAGSAGGRGGYDTICVIDCATDSIVKKLTNPGTPWVVDLVRWVPWSNRVYLTRTSGQESLGIIVVDCNTDSIIVPDLRLGYWSPLDIQLDPIRERIFAIGAESTTVHVLRDVVPGVAETPAPGPRLGVPVKLRELRDAVVVEYELNAPARVKATVFDAAGRLARVLYSGQQSAGAHRLNWNLDASGGRASPGAYFIVLDTGRERFRLKAVVR